MTKLHRRGAAAAVGVLLLAGLTACSNTSEGAGSASLVVDTNFAMKGLDPAQAYEATSVMVAHSVYETLLTYKGSDLDTPVGLLAESYELSGDAKTTSLKLNPKATFSDGSPVTAEDVVFSLHRMKNLQGPPAWLAEGLTVKPVGEHQVEIVSEKPNPAVPALLTLPAMGILNAGVVKSQGGTDAEDASTADTAGKWLNTHSAGSGQLEVSGYEPSAQITLTRTKKYWGDGEAGYDKVILRDTTAEVQKLNVQKGVSQLALDLSPTQAEGLGDSVKVMRETSLNTWFMFANADAGVSKVTADPKFREAVRFGVDYDSLLSLGGGGAQRSAGMISTPIPGSLSPEDGVDRDVARAQAALKSSGYTGEKVKLEYPSDLTTAGITYGDVAERIQASLKEVGINIELAPAPLTVALPRYREGKAAMGVWLWAADYPDGSGYLGFAPGESVGLRAGWAMGTNPEVTQAASGAEKVVESEPRGAAFAEFMRRISEGGPFVPLFQSGQTLVVSKSVDGAAYNGFWTITLSDLKPAN